MIQFLPQSLRATCNVQSQRETHADEGVCDGVIALRSRAINVNSPRMRRRIAKADSGQRKCDRAMSQECCGD